MSKTWQVQYFASHPIDQQVQRQTQRSCVRFLNEDRLIIIVYRRHFFRSAFESHACLASLGISRVEMNKDKSSIFPLSSHWVYTGEKIKLPPPKKKTTKEFNWTASLKRLNNENNVSLHWAELMSEILFAHCGVNKESLQYPRYFILGFTI